MRIFWSPVTLSKRTEILSVDVLFFLDFAHAPAKFGHYGLVLDNKCQSSEIGPLMSLRARHRPLPHPPQ